MAQKKRSSKKRSTVKSKRADQQAVRQLLSALEGLPRPARAVLSKNINGFRRSYPKLYDVMFKDVDSEHYREFERHLERMQERKRRDA